MAPPSAIGKGFNGAETNRRIAHILGFLLMNSYYIQNFFGSNNLLICGLSTLNILLTKREGRTGIDRENRIFDC